MRPVLLLAVIGALGALAWTLGKATPADIVTGEEDDSAGGLIDFTAQAEDVAQQYFDGVDGVTGQTNTIAFLRALRLGEGTSGSDGYYTLCGGGNASGLSQHPALAGWRGWPLPYQMAVNAGFPDGVAVSTAAGAYQITRPTWNGCAKALGLSDFSEASQDAAAVYLIKSKGALADVIAGRTEQAIGKLGGLWASLPGAKAKQRQVSLAQFNDQFTQNGGTLA